MLVYVPNVSTLAWRRYRYRERTGTVYQWACTESMVPAQKDSGTNTPLFGSSNIPTFLELNKEEKNNINYKTILNCLLGKIIFQWNKANKCKIFPPRYIQFSWRFSLTFLFIFLQEGAWFWNSRRVVSMEQLYKLFSRNFSSHNFYQ